MRSLHKSFERYAADILSSEINRVQVNKSAPTPVALVYPNYYPVGISSLGYQVIYRLFNEQPQFACERAFLYKSSLAKYMRTLESGRPLRSFSIIAFSLAYELDYVNVLTMLYAAQVPLLSRHRTENDPFIILGGVTTFYNPTPLAAVADAILIGEGEVLIPAFADVFNHCRDQRLNRAETLENLASVPGVYVPLFHGVESPNSIIERQHVHDLSDYPTFSTVVGSKGHLNMFMVELGRGCGRGCGFCVAGHVYHPFRVRTADDVLKTVTENVFGSNRIGLVGAALSDFPRLGKLAHELTKRDFLLGMSSLRIDCIDEILLTALDASGVRMITLAPEAGTERLREIIHKPIEDGRILSAVQKISCSKINTIKLYFMIGLPFEGEEDLEGIVTTVRSIQKAFLPGRGGRRIKVSINAFVPKPETPFQWAPMLTEKMIKSKRNWLDKQIRKIPQTIIIPKSARSEIWQGYLSLCDHRIGEAMADWITQGRSWKDEVRSKKIDQEWITQEKEFEIALPWDFIKGGLSKERLWQRWLNTKKRAGSL